MRRTTWVMCLGVLLAATAGGLCAAAGEENLLANPSFEQVNEKGVLSAWVLARHGEGKATIARVAGGRSQEEGNAFHAEIRIDEGLTWIYIMQVVARQMKAGEAYRYSAWLKADAPVKVDLVMYALGTSLEDAEKAANIQKRRNIELTPEWREFVLDDVVVDAKGDYGTLRPQVQVYDKNVTVLIDDAKVVQTK
ncbi:MAG: hypothetical protein V2A58_16250 [Planctomycetota bacterium]